MSPLRPVGPDDRPLFVERDVPPSRTLPVVAGLSLLLAAAAITVCTLVLIFHETNRRAAIRDVEVLSDVQAFMTMFTSPDPFHANDYVDSVLAHATGDFTKEYQGKANQILLAIGRNDDGSATLLVAVENTGKSPDGKQNVNVASRWLLTVVKEGDQWKISNLNQVL